MEGLRFLGAVSEGKINLVKKYLPEERDYQKKGLLIALKNANFLLVRFLIDSLNATSDELILLLNHGWEFLNAWDFDVVKTTDFVNIYFSVCKMTDDEKIKKILEIPNGDLFQFLTRDFDQSLIRKHLRSASVSVLLHLCTMRSISTAETWPLLKTRNLTYYDLSDFGKMLEDTPLDSKDMMDWQRKYDELYFKDNPLVEFWEMLSRGNAYRVKQLAKELRNQIKEMIQESNDPHFLDYFDLTTTEAYELFIYSIQNGQYYVIYKLHDLGAKWDHESFQSFIDNIIELSSYDRTRVILTLADSLKTFHELEQSLRSFENSADFSKLAIVGEVVLNIM